MQIDAQGRFAREWIALTDERVLLLNEATLETRIRAHIGHTRQLYGTAGWWWPLGRATKARGLLELYYSSSRAVFSEVAVPWSSCRRTALSINAHLDRLRCDSCQRLLPEKNGVCPACIKKGETLKRITRYLLPY